MEKRVLFFDCFSGISGDMTIGALLDLGIDKELFLSELNKIGLNEFTVEIKNGIKKGITGTDFTVILEDDHDIHHHHDDHEHHHGHSHHEGGHHHHHLPKESDHDHSHSRNLAAISEIIDNSELNDRVKSTSKRIFTLIAEAEGKIHGKSIDDVHFHEVGAVDSIVDIIGAAICLDLLNVDEIVCSPINLGSGFVKCAHGVFPVPAPATLEILRDVPVYSKNAQKELTTPTGAAILKGVCHEFVDFPALVVEKVGYGLGKRDMETPNVLRVVLGKKTVSNQLIMLETNIDNMNSEVYSYLFQQLFDAGALDVFVSPVVMKKSRPANVLSVLSKEDSVAALEQLIFLETTTLGIRKYGVERVELERKFEKMATRFGEITIKKAYRDGKLLKFSPEYEECRAIASQQNIPLIRVMNEIHTDISTSLNDLN